MARASVGGIVVAFFIAAPSLADEAVWVGPATGAWNIAANWSTGVVPGFNTAARIDDNPGQGTRVESRVNTSGIGMLSIDSGDTFAVINTSFSVSRPLLLDGTVSVEGTNSSFNAGVVVNPGGEIRLAGTNQTGATFNTTGLYNAGNIHGAGVLSLGSSTTTTTSWNESTIRADNPTVQFTITTPGQANLENDGTLAASGGGKLLIQRGNFSFDFGVRGGRIEAYPGSTVAIGATNGSSTAYVEDSVLAVMDDNDPNTAVPVFQFNGELKNVTLQGKFLMSGASIIGSLTNQTDLSPSSLQVTQFHNALQGDVLLKGGGTISLGASSFALFGATFGSTTSRLINVDNVIHGSGELLVSWYGFTNRGVVQADAGQNKELVFYNGLSQGLLVNSGVMKAINGGRLRLGFSSGQSSQMKNFEGAVAGQIVAGANSSVLLNLIQIQGGVLRTEGADAATRGKFIAEPGTVLQDVTLDGTFRLQTLAGVLSTITLTNTLHNTGSLTTRLNVAASTSVELAGGGEIISEAGTFLTLGQFATLTNDDNVIHGIGTMTSGSTNTTVTNRGTFRAEGGTLAFYNQQTVINSGLLDAAAGGTLTLPTFGSVLNYEGGVGGTIHAGAGGVVNAFNVDGGTLATDGAGLIKTTGFIKDIHNTGSIQALAGTTPQGTIVNDGVISGSMVLSSPFVRFDGSGRWEGAFGNFTGGTVENGPHHTILGVGDIGSTSTIFNAFENEGTLRADGASGVSFRVFTGSFENSGLVHAPAGKSLAINSLFSRASNSGTLQAEGNMDVTSPSGLYNESGGLIDVRATLTLKETRLRNRVGGTISGNGLISGPMTSGPLVANEGVVDPGPGLATLTVGDDFQQFPSGQLKIDVSSGATLANDLLQINGTASLAGSLLVTHVGSDALVAGNSFTFLAATGGVTGVFSQVTMPTLDPSLFWYLDYEATSVRALVADVIPGDFNRNGSLGAEDYVVWRHNAGSEQQYSDWVRNFGRTIDLGGAVSAAQVPEPAGLVVLIWATASWSLLRRQRLLRV